MEGSSPNQSRPGSDHSVRGADAHGPSSRVPPSADPRQQSTRVSSSRASVPPSEPRGSRASFDVLDAHVDRPARLQMIVALILGLVLVAIPLYLWRRPRTESITALAGAADAGVLPAVTAATTPNPDEKLVIGPPTNLSCNDPGPKKTAPEECDHVSELETAFAKAIEENAACVPREAGGGTIIYVADVAYKKKSLTLSTPKEGRTLKNVKVVTSCEKAVKNKLGSLPLEAMKHDHARYRVSITATYPGSVKP